MERKEITAWGMNTWTKDHGLIMFDEFAIGRIKGSISNFIAMQEGYEHGAWECIDIKILEKFSSYDAPEIAQGDVCFYAGRTLKARCDYAGDLVAYCFDDITHIDHLDAAYKLKLVLVKKSK
jgi:hypothetical protein